LIFHSMPRYNRDNWSKDYDHIIENAKDAPGLDIEKHTFRKTWKTKDETALVKQFGKVPALPVGKERNNYTFLANGFLACEELMKRMEACESTPIFSSDYFDYAQHQKRIYRNALDNWEKNLQARATNTSDKLQGMSQDKFYDILEGCGDYISWHNDNSQHTCTLWSSDPTIRIGIITVRGWRDHLKELEKRRRDLCVYRGPNASAGRQITWDSQDQDPEPEPTPKRARQARRPMSPTKKTAPKRSRQTRRSPSPTEPQSCPPELLDVIIPAPRPRTPEPMTTPPQASSPPKPVDMEPISSPPKPVSTEPEPDSQMTQLPDGYDMPELERYAPPPPPATAAVPEYESEEESNSQILDAAPEEDSQDPRCWEEECVRVLAFS